MPAREMRMEMFVRSLMRRDFNKAKGHLEKLTKMAGSNEWGRGYSRAVEGIFNALKENDADSLIVKILSENNRELAREFLERYEGLISQEFRDGYERGYYTAWVEFLRAYLNQKTLA
jgi:hypothetical protein